MLGSYNCRCANPEALHGWLEQLHDQCGAGRVALALESGNKGLLHLLVEYSLRAWLDVFPVHSAACHRFTSVPTLRTGQALLSLTLKAGLLQSPTHKAPATRITKPNLSGTTPRSSTRGSGGSAHTRISGKRWRAAAGKSPR